MARSLLVTRAQRLALVATLLTALLAVPVVGAQAGVPLVVEITPTPTMPASQSSTAPTSPPPAPVAPDSLGSTGVGVVLPALAAALVVVGVVLRRRRRVSARAVGTPAA